MKAKHFLDGLDEDLKKNLQEQLRILWAHTSTAIEGNSLTLGETHQVINDTYARVEDIAKLMSDWLHELNRSRVQPDDPLGSYVWLHAAFVRIHPFADGNGRLARLVANIPVLIAGEPPILIAREKRAEYIRLLGEWQLSLGRVLPSGPLVIENDHYGNFADFCKQSWEPSRRLVEEARELQKMR